MEGVLTPIARSAQGFRRSPVPSGSAWAGSCPPYKPRELRCLGERHCPPKMILGFLSSPSVRPRLPFPRMKEISVLWASPTLCTARALGQDGQDQQCLGDHPAISRFFACHFGAPSQTLMRGQADRVDRLAEGVAKLGVRTGCFDIDPADLEPSRLAALCNVSGRKACFAYPPRSPRRELAEPAFAQERTVNFMPYGGRRSCPIGTWGGRRLPGR